MSPPPRVAIGTLDPHGDLEPIVWALLEAFRRSGVQVQSYLSRAHFPRHAGAASITGRPTRHLDSWLMSADSCRDALLRGGEAADLAVIEGSFGDPPDGDSAGGVLGGNLATLCRWLNLPSLAVVDASRVAMGCLPRLPKPIDGILLDRAPDARRLAQLATDLEAVWGLPVLGALEALPELRAAIDAVPRGERPPDWLAARLGDEFVGHWQPRRIMSIAADRELGAPGTGRAETDPWGGAVTVAVAFDEAFNCYFPDSLDVLERCGAHVVDFSPLRDESLPAGTDVVYLGCGHPERHAAALEENHCMMSALVNHLRSGRPIYAEGGGAAYLCQMLETPDGSMRRMAGLLPAVARLLPDPRAPEPVEVTLARGTWLAPAGEQLRGYRNTTWAFEPLAPSCGLAAEPERRFDLVGGSQAVGSLVHFSLAAQPRLVAPFFGRARSTAGVADPWSSIS